MGTLSCVLGTVVDSCAPEAPAPSDSVCDGVDEDCDALVDEDFVPYCAADDAVACTDGAEISAPCSDGDACNGLETCSAGACVPSAPPELDDGNPCTVDDCDPGLGVTHAPEPAGTACSDGNVCDGDETCDGAGACASGTPLDVDDSNPCTADACDPIAGVSHAAEPPGTSCADGDPCNGEET